MLTINTYGHIDAAFYTLNAVAMIMKSDFLGATIKFFSLLCMAFAAVKASLESTTNPAYKKHLMKAFTLVIIINGMLVPKGEIMLNDHVSKKMETINNLPLGFILPIGFLETVGTVFTEIFEQSFSTVNFNYTSYGYNFGSALIQEMKNVKLQDPTLSMNVESFLDRCVLTTAAIGFDFTFDDLMRTNDIWGMIKPKMKDGIREVHIIEAGGQKRQMGCKTAASLIEASLTDEISYVRTLFRFDNFGMSGDRGYVNRGVVNPNASAYFDANLKKVFTDFLGQSMSAVQILRQLMIRSSFSKYGNYGTLKAIQNQETTWQPAK